MSGGWKIINELRGKWCDVPCHTREGCGCADAIDARVATIEVENERLRKALKPFADAVSNDNGDMTISRSALPFEVWADAYFALRKE